MRSSAFGIGVGLALALAAVAVELEGWGPARFTSFSTLCGFALVVVPFVHAATGLFSDYPRLATLVAPPVVSVMIYPVSVVNGWRWALASTGFLFAFAVLTLVYYLTVVVRERRPGGAYLAASLGVLMLGFVLDSSAGSASGAVWKIALVALGFALWAFDLYDRAGQVARGFGR